ncbi:MAG: hypothetical protein M3R04_04185 [bacterium]|nr:hypothetical protein [bacterium]
MSKAIKRLINDYLDGEIGLADKVELERLMAEDPEILREYKQLRRIGMQLSQMPEIRPHPVRLRAKVQEALDAQSRVFITPQRVFAGAMAVALVVIAVSFSLLVFQQRMLGQPVHVPSVSMESTPLLPDPGGSIATLDIAADCNLFFSRMLLEHELGMLSADVLGTVLSQTSVFEGSVCTDESMKRVRLQYPVIALPLRTTPAVAQQLSKLAEEVSGCPSPVSVQNATGRSISLEEYLRTYPNDRAVYLLMRFK